MLLPPYCKFKFNKSEEVSLPFNSRGFNAQGKEEVIPQLPVLIKIYYLEFVSFGEKSPIELQKECIKNLNIKGKRR